MEGSSQATPFNPNNNQSQCHAHVEDNGTNTAQGNTSPTNITAQCNNMPSFLIQADIETIGGNKNLSNFNVTLDISSYIQLYDDGNYDELAEKIIEFDFKRNGNFLTKLIDVNQLNKSGDSLLHIILDTYLLSGKEIKLPLILEAFLVAEFDVNLQDTNGNTIFHLVAEANNASLARILLAVNARSDIQNNSGKTALDIIISMHSLSSAKEFEKAGIKVNFTKLIQNILAANVTDREDIISSLQDINVFNSSGYTLLHEIVKNNLQNEHKEKIADIVQVFLNCGFDINLRANDNCKIIQYPIKIKPSDYKLINVILTYNANNLITSVNSIITSEPNNIDEQLKVFTNKILELPEPYVKKIFTGIENIYYTTPSGNNLLHILFQNHLQSQYKDKLPTILQVFLDRGVDINQPTANGTTLIQYAKETNHSKLINMILTHSGEPLINEINSALDSAEGISDVNLQSLVLTILTYDDVYIKEIIRSIKLINYITPKGDTLLHKIFNTGLLDLNKSKLAFILQCFLDNGFNINAKDKQGKAILHYSIKNGYAEATDILMDSNADLFVDNNVKNDVISAIIKTHDTKAMQHLLDKGYDLDVEFDELIDEIFQTDTKGLITIISNLKDINFIDNSGDTLLHKIINKSVLYKYGLNILSDIYTCFIKKDASPNIENKQHKTAKDLIMELLDSELIMLSPVNKARLKGCLRS